MDFTVIFTGSDMFLSVIRSLPATILDFAGRGHSSFVLEGTIRDTPVAIIIL